MAGRLVRSFTVQQGPLVAPMTTYNTDGGDSSRIQNSALSPSDGAPIDAEKANRYNSRPQPDVSKKQIASALLPAALMILAVFWINISHLYGLFHNQGHYTRKAHVAIVDFDGGVFGSSLLQAASSRNRTYGYPTYAVIPASATSPENIRQQVFEGTYWAAIYAFPGASDRFDAVVNGSSAAAYDPTKTLGYVTLTARYFALYESNFYSTSLTVTSIASAIIAEQEFALTLASRTATSPALSSQAVSALGQPAQAIEIPAAYEDFTADVRALLNTIGAVMPIIMQFFFLMAWNGISNGLHLFAAKNTQIHIRYRLIWALLWPLATSLCTVGWTFTFKGNYSMNAWQFFALWATSWLFAMITFELLDIITAYIPISFVPFFFFTYVICSVAAALGPTEILNDWYRVSYFFPSFHWFQINITIYTRGGVNHLDYNLPVLFAWWILLKIGSIFATRHRVKLGREAFASGTIVH